MYKYEWDPETGGLLLVNEISKLSNEPRPVYYRELDTLGFNQYWKYPHSDEAPLMWAEANKYIYKGRLVAKTQGGSLYTAPEIILLEAPEPDGKELEFVDIPAMVEKNRFLMETLEQETIQKIYNVYAEYKKKIDVFYVAFSGGKDSVVALDLVQRALPHDEFLVLFGDTRMEFPDTYKAVKDVQKFYEASGIKFYESKSEYDPIESWKLFGPPATTSRWCCSVHKTAPQILLLRKLTEKPNFIGMAFVGVRADESLARSKYSFVSYGEKHKGQYSCNAILEWNSVEVFSYIYAYNLNINETYKKGNRRAGCLVCPRAADRNDYMNHHCYYEEAEKLIDCIRYAYKETFESDSALEQFIDSGGWKARKNGRDLIIASPYQEKKQKNESVIQINNPRTNWKEWIKTIGILSNEESPYLIEFKGNMLQFSVEENKETLIISVAEEVCRNYPNFIKLLKNVFRKAACCVGCRECQADCPYGCISFKDKQVFINQECRHCSKCHKVEKGCLVYKSLERPKGGISVSGKTKSLNSYSHHAPKMEWIQQYFEFRNDFDANHTLGSQMYDFFKKFLRDCDLLDSEGFTETAKIIDDIGIDNEISWGIIFTNLAEKSAQIHWYVNNVKFNESYQKSFIASMLTEAGAKESWTNDIFTSFVRMSELPLGIVGFGTVEKNEKNRAQGITRHKWQNPSPLVILYSLYKFAENCGGRYQFTLSELMDDSIERDGVSPTQIFGLDRDTMVGILNGLTANYSEYINASFSLDLDNITLREEKTSKDILALF